MTKEEFAAIGKRYMEAKAAYEQARDDRMNAVVDARNDIGTTEMARLLGVRQPTVARLLRLGLSIRGMGTRF